jgi:diguanylate cyclase (GGDEF)-like protein/PAS domain S-box-containing protein
VDAAWVEGVLVAAGVVCASVLASMRFRRRLLERAEDERKRAELMASRFHAAVDGAPVGVTVIGMDGRVELVNDRLRELLRVPEDGDLSIIPYYVAEDAADVRATVELLFSGQVDHLVKERQLVRKDGSRLWCRISSSVLRDPDGAPSGVVAHIQDIEAERAAVEELRSRTRWFSSIVERSSDLITLFDRDGTVTWVSPSVGALLGREPQELLGYSIMALIHRDDRPGIQQALEELRHGRPARAEYRVPGPDGEWRWLESTASDLLDDPDVQAVIALSRDVTERHRTTELLAHRAAHDALTGLPNRAELEHQLEVAIERAAAAGSSLAVAYLDLDGFKVVNDSHGHGVGDELLRAVADRLRAQVRDGDVIARLGGDEFVVVLPGADLGCALGTAERIREHLGQPLVVEGVEDVLQVSVSVGLAVAGPDDTVTSLLRGADAALYEAKRRGRDRVEVSASGLDQLGDHVDELLFDALRDVD